ncbi:hypothetical protein [Nonomuraea fuscirosea]|uniref:hypothetical protein n=1 Tax=Nonomuraea fuscirosea TaxID=1291556 RepID=UPI00343B501D
MSPTLEHEYLIELVRNQPSFVTTLLTELNVGVPPFDEALLGNTDFTQCVPTEYQSDSVVTLKKSGKAVRAVVLEVQRKPDPDKSWSWPVYLATLRAREKCPVLLLVFSPNANTARTCAKPIDLGHPGWVLAPLVIGPEDVPAVTDITQAIAEPELTALSAIVYGNGDSPEKVKVLRTFVEAIVQQPHGRPSYSELVLMLLPRSDAINLYKEMKMAVTVDDLMHLPFVREWVEQGEAMGRAVGEALGEAESILKILNKRGIPVTDEARERILACTDTTILDAWLDRALTATSIDEVLS